MTNSDLPWNEITESLLSESKTPEDYLMDKDIFRAMSEEALTLCKIIINAPNELYNSQKMNQINWKKVYNLCRKEHNWTRDKVKLIRMEIRLMLVRW